MSEFGYLQEGYNPMSQVSKSSKHSIFHPDDFPSSVRSHSNHLFVFFSPPFIRNTRSISMELGPVLHREMDFWEVRLIIQNHRKQDTTVEINKLSWFNFFKIMNTSHNKIVNVVFFWLLAAPGVKIVPTPAGVVISQGAQVYQPHIIAQPAVQVTHQYIIESCKKWNSSWWSLNVNIIIHPQTTFADIGSWSATGGETPDWTPPRAWSCLCVCGSCGCSCCRHRCRRCCCFCYCVYINSPWTENWCHPWYGVQMGFKRFK